MLHGLLKKRVGMPWFFCTLLLPNSPKSKFSIFFYCWNTGFWHSVCKDDHEK